MSVASRTEVENQIKLLSDFSWLTPSQVALHKELVPFLGGFHRIINLYGSQGVGKTFLFHILRKQGLVDYVASPELMRRAERPLVVDNNTAFDRTAVRGMRNQMRKFELQQIILVTRYRVEDSAVPAFALSISAGDILHFRSNLFRHLDLRLPDCIALNLWEHLKLIGGTNG